MLGMLAAVQVAQTPYSGVTQWVTQWLTTDWNAARACLHFPTSPTGHCQEVAMVPTVQGLVLI